MPGSAPSQRTQARFNRRAFGLAGLGGAAALALGCKGGRNSGTPAQKSSNATPRAGGQLKLVTTIEPVTFDPIQKSAATGIVLRRTHDGLVSFKSGPDVPYDTGTLEPRLADRWESPDAQTYTFHLRSGVNFQNLAPVNGRALSAADVKWTFEYLGRVGQFSGQPALPATSMWDGLERVETPDAATVVFHFAQPLAPFLNYAATPYAYILAHEVHDQDGSFDKNDVGTGPWQLDTTESARGQHWVYKRHPGYFNPDLPYIQEVHDLVITDASTQIAALQTRQVDELGVSYDQMQQVQNTNRDLVVYQFLPPQDDHVYMNNQKPPLSDARVRKALALCIDRDAFIGSLSHGKGQWAMAGSMPGLFTEQETKQILRFDPAQASQLLSAAGHESGVSVEFMFSGSRWGPTLVAKLQLLQAQLRQAGIALSLKDVDDATETKRRVSGDFDLAYTPSGQFLAADLDGPLYTIHYSKSANNYSHVSDPALDALLVQQRREVDPSKRRAVWRQAVQRINEIPLATALYYGQGYAVWQPYVRNFALNIGNFGLGDDWSHAWLSK